MSPLYYEDGVRASLLRFKFEQCPQYARVYASLMLRCIEEHFGEKYDILSYVPVSKKRLAGRGYDQSKLLAEEIGSLTGRRVETVIVKHRDAPPQSGMGSEEKRKANILGAYTVKDAELIKDKCIRLIDDISTTGSTLSECAKTLLLAGADKVLCCTVAKSRD